MWIFLRILLNLIISVCWKYFITNLSSFSFLGNYRLFLTVIIWNSRPTRYTTEMNEEPLVGSEVPHLNIIVTDSDLVSIHVLCIVYVLYMYCICIVYVLYMYCICIVYVLYMYCICIVYVLYMYCICIFYVYFMYILCIFYLLMILNNSKFITF